MKQETKTPITAKGVFIEVTYFLLIVLLSVAGGSKLIDHQKFVGEMLNQAFPHWFSWVLIYTLPYYELAIVTAILVGRKYNFKKLRLKINLERLRKWALLNSCVLMSFFLLYSILALSKVFGRVPCSCGGIIERLHWPQHVVLNAFYVLITIVSLRLTRQERPAVQISPPIIAA